MFAVPDDGRDGVDDCDADALSLGDILDMFIAVEVERKVLLDSDNSAVVVVVEDRKSVV